MDIARPEIEQLLDEFKKAFHADDAARVRSRLETHPELGSRINDPLGPFDSPLIMNAKSRAMLDVLIDAGADVNAKSRWWAGGFGLLHVCSPELAAYAIDRGAIVDVHAAARLDMMDRLRELITQDPALVHARGGDGQTPLHFARTVQVAEFLLDHGAEIDALDVDHESTPAQYTVDHRQPVTRVLINRGCKTDILMASALGDLALVRAHLDADPECIRTRVSDAYFPMIRPNSGGTIYQWTLGFHVGAHQVARKFGHEDIVQYLFDHGPDHVNLIAACWLGDETRVKSLRPKLADLAAKLVPTDRRQVAHAARNNEANVVRLMLESGLPADAGGQHGATPLHWGAFHGNVAMVKLCRYGGSDHRRRCEAA
jgi:ankyrin repeat protein